MAGGKRPHSEGSSSSHKAPKNTSTNTRKNDSAKRDDLTQQLIKDEDVGVSGDQNVAQPQGLISSDEAHDEVLAMPGNKGDFTDGDYKSLVHTAFQLIGRDVDEHAELVQATVDWMRSTNFVATKTWSDWTGEKKLCELLEKVDRMAGTFPISIFVPTAKFTISAFIMLHLMKDIKFEPTDESFKLLKRHNIFRYLGQSIDSWEGSRDVFEVIQLGFRPDAGFGPGVEVVHPEPVIPGRATCELSNSMLLTPDPRSTRSVILRQQMTSEEWLALNQDWLPKLGNRHFDNKALENKIAEQVTFDTAPLIPEEYRNKLWSWFGEFNKAGRSIIDVEFKPSVEIQTRAEDLAEPERPVEQSLRRAEDLVGKLPDMCSETAAGIKDELNRLFAHHEADIKDELNQLFAHHKAGINDELNRLFAHHEAEHADNV